MDKKSIVKPSNGFGSSFHPVHLEDLRKSGLSDETIKESGIRSVPPDEIDRIFGYPTEAQSCYEIPYGGGYSRYRMFYSPENQFKKDGSERPKYLGVAGTGNRLYIPARAREVLQDVSVPLYLTEGEKKSLKAFQEGLLCVAIAGLWNWADGDKELISDFNEIALGGRAVYIVPDNDFRLPNRKGERKNLKQAVDELGCRLINKGARVSWVEMPEGAIKIGLDDYLCSHTITGFEKLKAHTIRNRTIDEMIEDVSAETPFDEIENLLKRLANIPSAAEKAKYLNAVSSKTGIPKMALRKDVEHYAGKNTTASERRGDPTPNARFKGLVDLVVIDDGSVSYLLKDNGELRVESSWDVGGTLCVPPSKEHLPFAIPSVNRVLEWYLADNDQKLFEDVLVYLKRFSCLSDSQWAIIACKVFLTYLQEHPDIHYQPMILFFAVPERGKSRTGKSATYISYRGVHLVDLREANLFRFSQNLNATLFFDLMDLWKKAEKNGAEDIFLLRYEKGARAVRVIFPEKGAFDDTVYYDIHGPTFIATNEPVHKILGSRCIGMDMQNKPGNYENPTPEKGLEIKERLTAWRARVMDKPLPEAESVEGLSGRLWDISKPLLQICKLVYPQGFDGLKSALLEVAGTRAGDKRESIEGQIIGAILELSPRELSNWNLKVSEVLVVINRDRQEGHKLTSQWLGKKLKAMRMATRHVNGVSEILLNTSDFNILLGQYGFEKYFPNVCSNYLPLSTNSTSPTESRDTAGRVSVDSGGNSTNYLPAESLVNSGRVELVELGRVSGGAFEKNNCEPQTASENICNEKTHSLNSGEIQDDEILEIEFLEVR